MKMLCGMAVLVLVLLVATVALAGAKTPDGNNLLKWCTDHLRMMDHPDMVPQSDRFEVGVNALHCGERIAGMLDMNTLYQVEFERKEINKTHLLFCPPVDPGPSLGQAVRIVLRHLQMHPERLHGPGISLITEALRDAFPCPPAASRPQR